MVGVGLMEVYGELRMIEWEFYDHYSYVTAVTCGIHRRNLSPNSFFDSLLLINCYLSNPMLVLPLQIVLVQTMTNQVGDIFSFQSVSVGNLDTLAAKSSE